MNDLVKLKRKIEQGEPIKLSSGFTKAGAISAVLLVLVVAYFMAPQMFNKSDGLQANVIVAGILFLVLIFLAFYQLIFASEAELTGKKLKLKKVIGKVYEINVDQIEKIRSFRSKSTKYTIIRFKTNNGLTEKALILNSNSILFGKEVTAGEAIEMAQKI